MDSRTSKARGEYLGEFEGEEWEGGKVTRVEEIMNFVESNVLNLF